MGGSPPSNMNTTTSSSPWVQQQDYIKQGLSEARGIYGNNVASGPYQGNFTAGGNPTLTAAGDQASNYASNIGGNLASTAAGAAAPLMAAGAPFVSNASNIAANGIAGPNAGLYGTLNDYGTGSRTAAGPSTGLSSALNDAAIYGANSLRGFQTGLQDTATQASMDPTQRTIADASAMMSNPALQAQLDNVNNQIDSTLHETTIPGLNRQAAMGGALNSSRAGMGEAMANRDAALAKGNASSQILGNAWNSGLSTAANQWATGLNTSLNANMSGLQGAGAQANSVAGQQTQRGQFDASTALAAAGQGLGTNLQYGLGDASTRLNANAQLGNAAGLGFNGANAANGLASSNFDLYGKAGALQQTNEQAGLQNDLQKWQMQNQYQQGLLNNYWNIVGQPAGTQTNVAGQNQSGGPGIAQSLLGGAAGAAGLASNLFGKAGAFPQTGAAIGSGLADMFGMAGPASAAAASAASMGPGVSAAAGLSSAGLAGLMSSAAPIGAESIAALAPLLLI